MLCDGKDRICQAVTVKIVAKQMNAIQNLPPGPLDIVGDIHGEIEALTALLRHLGYDADGNHPRQRTLIFVGDLVDRGPDSPTVLKLVERLVKTGRAFAILGNHEINLLANEAKDGSGWYFDERVESDNVKYAPFIRATFEEKIAAVAFLLTLPIALERPDLRIIHAAWIAADIEKLREVQLENVLSKYKEWDAAADNYAKDLRPKIREELKTWPYGLEDQSKQPPFLHAHAEHDSVSQMMNPLKILTSGVEREASKPFYASGKWRFLDRVKWWDEYDEPVPVVIGHYWRRYHSLANPEYGKGEPGMFDDIPSNAWHGKRGNVFCIDYSVGGRWSERKFGEKNKTLAKLGALKWPERVLIFDDGVEIPSIGPD